jgi:NADPH2:quinone reductase
MIAAAEMKSCWIKTNGNDGATELEWREVPVPQPAAGRLLVRMRATSLNRGDMLARIRRHSAQGGRPAGIDGAGEVVDGGGTAYQVGDRVLFRAHACFAEYALVDPALAARVPESLSWEEAASVPAAFITAWEAVIQFGRLRAGEWLLIVGASSGVGVAALQIARHLGARVIGTSGSARKLAALKALGMDVGIEARGSGFANAVLAATAKGVDVAVNLAGGTAFPGCVRVAADFGRIIIVGYVDGVLNAEIDLESVHGRRLQISGISNSPLTPAQRALAHEGFMRDVYPALATGAIKPVIDRVFAFDELPAAKAYVDTDQLLGKVVIRLP